MQPLTSRRCAQYLKDNHPGFIEVYTDGKKDPYSSLLMMIRRTAQKIGLKQRRTTKSKLCTTDMNELRNRFIEGFKVEVDRFESRRNIINIDETSIWFDPLPTSIMAYSGNGKARVAGAKKHCGRITTVLAIAADGTKLPILFILPGAKNGTIARQEVKEYNTSHYYLCQKNAWMDSQIWQYYLQTVLKPHLVDESLIVVDNLDCHVSDESVHTIQNHLASRLYPLPENCTSICQPLDVGVMGPLKKKIQTRWLQSPRVTTAKAKRKLAIELTISAFNDITEHCVRRSWQKSILPH